MTTSAWMVAGTPLIIFLFHCTLERGLRRKSSTQTIAILTCVGGWAISAASAIYFSQNSSEVVFCVLTTLLLGHLYFHLFNMSETARRIKILRLLERNENPSQALQSYSAKEQVEQRLNRLLNLHQAELHEGKIIVTGKTLQWIARVMIAYGNVLFPSRSNLRLRAAALKSGEVDGQLRDPLKVAK